MLVNAKEGFMVCEVETKIDISTNYRSVWNVMYKCQCSVLSSGHSNELWIKSDDVWLYDKLASELFYPGKLVANFVWQRDSL